MKALLTSIALCATVSAATAAECPLCPLPSDSLNTDSIDRSYDMNEVVVQSQRKLITNQVDRVTYDIQADEDSKTSTLQQMLNKVPMVSVEADGTIKVNGSTNFVIFKNGKPNKTMQSNPKEVLAAIPASSIKKIEVITEPGAKYDAEGIGAILNIVTDKSVSTNGFMGSVNAKYKTISDWPTGNIWLSGQKGKFAASLVYGYERQSARQTETIVEQYGQYLESGNTSSNTQNQKYPVNVHYFNFEASLDISPRDLLTAEFGGYTYTLNVDGTGSNFNWNKAGALISNMAFRFSLPTFSYWDLNGGLNYQHTTSRQGESLNLAYRIATTDNHRIDNVQGHDYCLDTIGSPQMFDAYDKDERLKFMEHTFEADWTRPLGKGHTLDVGAKYIIRINKSDSKMEYENPLDPSINNKTLFKHTTNIAAVYADYKYNIKRWGFRAGIRYEYSHLKSHDDYAPERDFSVNLSDWVPSVGISFRPTDFSMLKLNYSRRIQRPGISYLNPYREFAAFSLKYGNPNLESAALNSLTLAYQLTNNKLTLMPNIGLNWTNNLIGMEQFVIAKDSPENPYHLYDITVSTYENNIKSLSFHPSLYVQWQVANTTSIMANLGAIYNRFTHKSNDLKNTGWGYSCWLQLKQKLPWKLTTELSGYVQSNGAIDLYTIGNKPFYGGSLTLRRDFLKEDRLSVAIAGGIQAKRVTYTETVQGDSRGWMKATMPNNAYASFSVSYRFGSMKTSVKKTNKKIENDDQVGGVQRQ
ncbi:MAG: TonB-dependent receptor [Bacteroidaceae bacterium]|nr:TonB-dependent receptor [Bacteroidaceae bacterium]